MDGIWLQKTSHTAATTKPSRTATGSAATALPHLV